jgi:hypothetical protein
MVFARLSAAQLGMRSVDQAFAGVLEVHGDTAADDALHLADAPIRRAVQRHKGARFEQIRHRALRFCAVASATIHN